jgi:fumarate hydratase class II
VILQKILKIFYNITNNTLKHLLIQNLTTMNYRIEKDTMGEVQVPADKYWGAQTQRSKMNFKIGPEASMPKEIIYAFGILKKAAALTNSELGVLDKEKAKAISEVCDEIIAGKLYEHFHLANWLWDSVEYEQ